MILNKQFQNRDAARSDVIVNWQNLLITPNLCFSHRCTEYTRGTYPIGMHFHDYAELVFILRGDVRYICGNTSRVMKPWDVVFVPAGSLHTSAIISEKTLYERFVIYFYPHSLDACGGRVLMERFLKTEGPFLALPQEKRGELMHLLTRLEKRAAGGTQADAACSCGIFLELFYLLGKSLQKQEYGEEWLPGKTAEIRAYVDEHFAEISGVCEVAEHFFYSREYVSRLFRKGLGIPISDYLRKKRISAAQQWIGEGLPLTEVCFRVGFGSLSAFIHSFREETGMTPSEYRKTVSKP